MAAWRCSRWIPANVVSQRRKQEGADSLILVSEIVENRTVEATSLSPSGNRMLRARPFCCTCHLVKPCLLVEAAVTQTIAHKIARLPPLSAAWRLIQGVSNGAHDDEMPTAACTVRAWGLGLKGYIRHSCSHMSNSRSTGVTKRTLWNARLILLRCDHDYVDYAISWRLSGSGLHWTRV